MDSSHNDVKFARQGASRVGMSTPQVSICVTSYNHKYFVRAAVESARQQTFDDWEMIVIDDGSSDGTLEALADLCDERIQLHAFSSNKTRCVALNQCLDRAKGRHIAILNSDDLWHPQKLEKQLAILDAREDLGAVFSWVDVIDDHGNCLGKRNYFNLENQSSQEWLKHLLLSGTPFCHASALVRRKAYADVGSYDERFTQLLDFEQWIRLCEAYEVWIIPEFLTKERQLSDQSNVSAPRPDAYARTNWERALAYHEALRRNHPQLRRTLQDLDPSSGQITDLPQDREWESEQHGLARILFNLPIHDLPTNKDNAQALKVAAALYLFQTIPPNCPGEAPSEQPKTYHQWIRHLDPLCTIERMSSDAEVRNKSRQLQEAQRQLEQLHAKTILRLSAPLRGEFWRGLISAWQN